jgi:hypothetical protein
MADEFAQLFIGGCPRSGTTLLARLLLKLDAATAPPESQFKSELVSGDPDGSARKEEIARLSAHWQRRAWQLPQVSEWPWRSSTRRQLMEWLVRSHAGRPNGDILWIDHTPDNMRESAALGHMFPESRFIHIVRDCRAVYASVRGLDWGPNTPGTTARWWLQCLAHGSAAQERLGAGRCLRVVYEELLEEPEGAVAEIGRWLGASMGDADVRAYDIPGYSRQQHALVNEAVDKGRALAWQQVLRPREIEVIESICGGMLSQLGYQRRCPGPRPMSRFEALSEGAVEGLRRAALNPVRRTIRRRTP